MFPEYYNMYYFHTFFILLNFLIIYAWSRVMSVAPVMFAVALMSIGGTWLMSFAFIFIRFNWAYTVTGNKKVKDVWKKVMAIKKKKVCGWCKKSNYRTSREGCYGSIIHYICLTPKCGHEWDEVE